MIRVLASLLLIAFLAACNTMKGLGEDIERGGEKLQNSAEKNKR